MKMGRIEKWFINRPQHGLRAMKRAERLLSCIDMQGKCNLLEVGCGNGAVSKHIARKYPFEVTGVDIDQEMIRSADKGIFDIPNIRFVEADATSLPFPDENYNIVLSFGVMHHVSSWLEALAEIRRVLKPGGYFVYADLIYIGPIAKVFKLFKHSYGVTNMNDLNKFLRDNNFTTINESYRNAVVWYNCEAVYRRN